MTTTDPACSPDDGLAGRRILVVGASSGIGRRLGTVAAARGARVVFAARRRAMAAEAAEAAGNGCAGVACDVRDPTSCAEVVTAAVDAMGGLDALVYAAAIDPLVRLTDASNADWDETFRTNVVGAAMVCRAALGHLRTARGRAVFISASSVGRPLPGMSVYASSKAALEEMVRGWRTEHPDVAFSTVRVGSALGTGVTDSWDPALLAALAPTWDRLGYVHDNGPGAPMSVEQAAEAVLVALTSAAWIREVTVVADPGRPAAHQ